MDRGEISNTDSLLLKFLGLALLAATMPLTEKRVQGLLGVWNWAFRPLPGFSLLAHTVGTVFWSRRCGHPGMLHMV